MELMRMKENRVQVTHTLSPELKRDLRKYARYSYLSESQVLERSLLDFLQSKKAFQKLLKEDAEKELFFEQFSDECDLKNYVGDPAGLCGYSKPKKED